MEIRRLLAWSVAWCAVAQAEELPWREELPPAAYDSLASLSGRVSAIDLDRWLARVIDPRRALHPYLSIRASTLEVRRTPEAAPVQVALGPTGDFRFASYRDPTRPLEGLKILLDPGHYGGAWSKIEARHFSADGLPPVREVSLTYGTARMTQLLLERAGASVRLTRGAPPDIPFAPTLDPRYDPAMESSFWLAKKLDESPFNLWLQTLPRSLPNMIDAKEKIIASSSGFELFNHFDLTRRGRFAEEWRADVTISIHYNANDTSGSVWTNANGVVVFVPGNFLPLETGTESERFFAIRHALSGELDDTILLAQSVARSMAQHLQLGVVGFTDGKRPEEWLPLDAKSGVYARNLAVLRRATGLVILTEGPFMNNPAEYRRLIQEDIVVDGVAYPERAFQYANGLAEAVIANVELLRRSQLRRVPSER